MLETLNFSNKQNVNKENKRIHSHVAIGNNPICYFCKGTNWTNQCQNLLTLTTDLRYTEIKKRKLCTNCLKPNHTNKEGKSSKCKKCNNNHHTLLHFERKTDNSENSKAENSLEFYGEAVATQKAVINLSKYITFTNVILSTANVYIFDANNKKHIC